MWKQKISLSIGNRYGFPACEVLNIHSKPNRHENDIYSQMPLELYFTQAYQRACKLAWRYAK